MLNSKFLGFALLWDLGWDSLNVEGDKEALKEANEIENKLQNRSLAIYYHIQRALKDAACLHLTNGGTIKHSSVRLAKDANEGMEIWMEANVIANIAYDPMTLIELPNDYRLIGETWLNIIEQGLAILSEYPNFPADVIRAACETFRENDYTLKLFSPKPTTITGTKLKGRVDTYIDAVSLRRDLTVSYLGQELLTKTISHFDRIDVANSAEHHSIELVDRTLTFHPLSQEDYEWWLETAGPYEVREPVKLDLNDFPEALEFAIEKGWTS